MTKTVTAGMTSHLGLGTTNLASLWRITRVDGVEFFFTDHDANLPFEGNIYIASVGYDRTAISNRVGLNVDELNVTGFLDSSAITEAALRAGLFDKAEVLVGIVNWSNLSDGQILQRRGHLGEVIYNDSGLFETELRGLTQAYSQRLVELHEGECAADLGDTRCKIAILPDVLGRNQTVTLDQAFRVQTLSLPVLDGVSLIVPGDTDADDKGPVGASSTLGAQAAISTVQKVFGAGSIEFSPSGSVDPSTAFVSYPDNIAYDIGTGEFNMEGWIRFKDLTDTDQTIASHYLNSGNQRGWILDRDGSTLRLRWSNSGTAIDVTISGAFVWAIDTDYHVAASRDSSGDVRLFVGGTQVGSTTNNTTNIHNSTDLLRLGKIRSVGFDDHPLNGFIDDFQFICGKAVRVANFSVPVVAHTITEPAVTQEVYENRVYRVTTAGVTECSRPTYDETIGNTTTDGTAVLTAEDAFARDAVVATVVDTQREFTITVAEARADAGDFSTDWFKYGAVIWESGNNFLAEGLLVMEIKQWTQGSKTVELFLDMPFEIQVGDKLIIYAGCDKKLATCRDKFANAINFRGFPYLPGQHELVTGPPSSR